MPVAVPPKEVAGGFGPLRLRCLKCKKIFRPHARLRERQRTCGSEVCQRTLRANYQRSYRKRNPELEREYQAKRKSQLPRDYWKLYRRNHPLSTERNRKASRLRKKLRHAGLQRKLDIVQVIDPPGLFDRYCEFATRHRSLIKELIAISAA